jgi:hypothetical protein
MPYARKQMKGTITISKYKYPDEHTVRIPLRLAQRERKGDVMEPGAPFRMGNHRVDGGRLRQGHGAGAVDCGTAQPRV